VRLGKHIQKNLEENFLEKSKLWQHAYEEDDGVGWDDETGSNIG
jgi:hypothetical protein